MADYSEHIVESGIDVEADGNKVICGNISFYWDRYALISAMMVMGPPQGKQDDDHTADYVRHWRVPGINGYEFSRDTNTLTINLDSPEHGVPVIEWAANTLRNTYAARETTESILRPKAPM
jgi:hypothetical protein